MTSDLKRRTHAVVAATFGLPLASISDATSSATVESWDSVHHIHLIVALEAEFGVAFEFVVSVLVERGIALDAEARESFAAAAAEMGLQANSDWIALNR